MHFQSLFRSCVLVTILSSAVASPLRTRDPDPPSVDECKKQLSVPNGKGLFYSNIGDPEVLLQQKRDYLKGYTILDQAFKDKDWEKNFVDDDGDTVEGFWDNCSEAFSELSTGTVYVVLPKGKGTSKFPGDSLWTNVEWDALKDNSKVKKIIRLEMKDQTHKETIYG
ncbi:hypothetical protein F4778DRAFT_748931 [Xylariomycetidae sp. FL2044]|nr:hypothetical protein F4778DRAFT_748931 [Xylariomycetidae sp. FL2044]